MGRPVSVARMSRWMRYFDPVHLSRPGELSAVVIVQDRIARVHLYIRSFSGSKGNAGGSLNAESGWRLKDVILLTVPNHDMLFEGTADRFVFGK